MGAGSTLPVWDDLRRGQRHLQLACGELIVGAFGADALMSLRANERRETARMHVREACRILNGTRATLGTRELAC